MLAGLLLPGADIVIGDDFVSARHARVSPAGTDAIVEDLGSTNGTLLNGSKIAKQELKTGDRLRFGASCPGVVVGKA